MSTSWDLPNLTIDFHWLPVDTFQVIILIVLPQGFFLDMFDLLDTGLNDESLSDSHFHEFSSSEYHFDKCSRASICLVRRARLILQICRLFTAIPTELFYDKDIGLMISFEFFNRNRPATCSGIIRHKEQFGELYR